MNAVLTFGGLVDNSVSKDLLYFVRGRGFITFVSSVIAVAGSIDDCEGLSVFVVEIEEEDELVDEDVDESSESPCLVIFPFNSVLFFAPKDAVLPIVTRFGRMIPSIESPL